MARHVALLRGINVGKHKRIAMADLRALLDDLGFTSVRTLLNSGNVLFTADDGDHAAAVEAAITQRFGLDVRCVVLSAGELNAIVEGHPFGDVADNGSRMVAHALSADPDPALLAVHDVVALDPDRAALGPRVIYQWCPAGILEAPPLMAFAEKHLGVVVTARNWNTITKLAELL